MMEQSKKSDNKSPAALQKCPSGIAGLDMITYGGLPRNRTTLVCGGAGSGKTLFGIEFLVKGCTSYDEPGVLICFEEKAEEISRNVASLGYDLPGLVKQKKLVVDHIHVLRSEIEETGEYNLDGLFIRLDYAIQSIGARRVVLDTIEVLFAALDNTCVLRGELQRLFHWLKEKNITAIVTGERGDGRLTRHGLEEYVSDCVINLDNRVNEQIATRRLHIVKYRGSTHGQNEYPFLLDEQGFTVIPITAIDQNYPAPTEFVSTGIAKLDEMLGGSGYYRGGTMLASGTAGTGKSSIAAHFIDAACQRGERAIYYAFEEGAEQIKRNMRSIGIDLGRWEKKGLLRIHSVRPSSCGIEMLLATILRELDQFQPNSVALDPISSFDTAGSGRDATIMTMRMVDHFKSRQITALFTSLTSSGKALEQSEVGVSSLIDTWVQLSNMEQGGERTRLLYVIKARGMAQSNRVREFVLTDKGIDLIDVYMGPDGILTGQGRAVQEMRDRADRHARERKADQARQLIENKRKLFEARIAELKIELEKEICDIEAVITEAEDGARNELNGRTKAVRTLPERRADQ